MVRGEVKELKSKLETHVVSITPRYDSEAGRPKTALPPGRERHMAARSVRLRRRAEEVSSYLTMGTQKLPVPFWDNAGNCCEDNNILDNCCEDGSVFDRLLEWEDILVDEWGKTKRVNAHGLSTKKDAL